MSNAAKLRAVLLTQRKKSASARLRELLELPQRSRKQASLSKLLKLADQPVLAPKPAAPSPTVKYNPTPAAPSPTVKYNPLPAAPTTTPRYSNGYVPPPPPRPSNASMGYSSGVNWGAASSFPSRPAAVTRDTPGAIPYFRGTSGVPAGYMRPEDSLPAGARMGRESEQGLPVGDPEVAARAAEGLMEPKAPEYIAPGESPSWWRDWHRYVGFAPRQVVADPNQPSVRMNPNKQPGQPALLSNEEMLAQNVVPRDGQAYSADELDALRSSGVITPGLAGNAKRIVNPLSRGLKPFSAVPQRGFNFLTGHFATYDDTAQAYADQRKAIDQNLGNVLLSGRNTAANIAASRAAQNAAQLAGVQGVSESPMANAMTDDEAQANVAAKLEQTSPFLADASNVGYMLSPFATGFGPSIARGAAGLAGRFGSRGAAGAAGAAGSAGGAAITNRLAQGAFGVAPFISGAGSGSPDALAQKSVEQQYENAAAQQFGENVRAAGPVKVTRVPNYDAQGRPAIDPQTGQARAGEAFQVEFDGPDGNKITTTVNRDQVAAAGLLEKITNPDTMPKPEDVTSQAADAISKNPFAANQRDSLNTTGQAAPGTAEGAASILSAQGKNENEIKTLTDWWGEPGNIATTLGIGAAAIGFMMMFMGGQDGLMGFLLPALGIATTAGGLGTLGYQGMFGKDVQNFVQGAANPLLQMFSGGGGGAAAGAAGPPKPMTPGDAAAAANAKDNTGQAGLGVTYEGAAGAGGAAATDPYWTGVASQLPPEQLEQLNAAYGKEQQLNWLERLFAPRDDEGFWQHAVAQNPQLKVFDGQRKQQIIDHIRGRQRLPLGQQIGANTQ